ncbi:MAG: thioredoxin family protein [Thermorudis peleae]|nr:thioredoxin family protein [Thermorudis peleae]
MVHAAELWDEAMTPDEYLQQMTKNRERFEANITRTRIMPGDWAAFGQEPLHILVLTEDWCSDSAQFVPMVIRLSQLVPTVEVRILRRDEHKDLAEQYQRKDGYQPIPVFILLDAEFQELGALLERPERATQEMTEETRRFLAEHPDLPGANRMIDRMPEETRQAVKAHIAAWRDEQFDRWTRYLIEDLAEIAKSAKLRVA